MRRIYCAITCYASIERQLVAAQMINLVLHAPEIAPNTGNAIRLAANTGAKLHLVKPLGFTLEAKAVRRAGLDYRDMASVQVHANFDACIDAIFIDQQQHLRVFLITTQGTQTHADVTWRQGDIAVFGSESAGLPAPVHASPRISASLRLPMRPDNRSLNLSNAVAVVAYEAWRQQGFIGAGVAY